MPTADLLDSRNLPLAQRIRNGVASKLLYSEVFKERYASQVESVKGVALAEIAGLVAAAKPAGALFGAAVGK